MTMDSAREAHGEGYAGGPSGFRRLTPNLLRADRTAEDFAGLPDGVTAPGQLLAAFKAAAPRLGLSPRLVHAVDWLFRFTQPQDWGRGGRPIVWPSASLQREALGLSPSQVKATNRALIEAGLITMKDSPNGKRYGVRDRAGRITEAYGFDLASIAARHAEFVRLAEEARAERAEMGRLRRRATIARNGITQILETSAEYGFQGEDWASLARDARNLATALRRVERPEEMALGVKSLERRQRAARERLEALLSAVTAGPSEVVDSDPKGPENRPHQYTYKPSLYPQSDTVIAPETAHQVLGVAPTGARRAALDVADEGKDLNAFCGMWGCTLDALEEWSGGGGDIFDTVGRAFGLCDAGGFDGFRYDADGLGAGVRGDARVLNTDRRKPIDVEAFRGSGAVHDPDGEDVKGRKNQDFFANAKAQAWWALRTRFQKTYRWVNDGVTLRKVEDVPDHLLAHLSPLGWEHVNLTGDYVWGNQQGASENTVGLRPLRATPELTRHAA